MDESQGQLIVTEPRALSTIPPLQPLSVKDLITRIQQIQQVMHTIMKDRVHYGIIPGTQKPSLWRAGAEILALTFRISARPEVELLQENGEIGYRVATPAFDNNESLLTIGWGECWTTEEKFAWREAVCQEEWDETDASRRRKKWRKDDEGEVFTTSQIRQNPSDQRNAVLKRACKRSYVDAVIKATAASDIFDQQLEDDEQGEPRLTTKQKPKAGMPLQGILKTVTAGAQGKPSRVVITYDEADLELSFFEAPSVLKAIADWNTIKGRSCAFTYEQRESKGKIYRNLKTLTWIEAAPQTNPGEGLPGFSSDSREDSAA